MTDRELLEWAAKAAEVKYNTAYGKGMWVGEFYSGREWNPLTYDGDAFRLAVKLRISPYLAETPPSEPEAGYVIAKDHGPEWFYVPGEIGEPLGEQAPIAATRRAIVRAAAAIGQSLAATSSGDSL